jgi:hypothetical protein
VCRGAIDLLSSPRHGGSARPAPEKEKSMPMPTVREIDEARLGAEDHAALDILRQLPVEKLNTLKELMRLGDPGIIGPQTLAAFRRLCEQHRFDLTPAGVNAFKDAHQLGNTGALRGIIGAQTAAVYFDELMERVSGDGERSLEKKVLAITGAFEGRGFTNLAGDFDGQGISFGVLQWNFGQGSLPPVLKQMHERDPGRFQEILGPDTDRFLALLNADRAAQLTFAREINDSHHRVVEPWRTRFVRLGEHPPFQDVQVTFADRLFRKATTLARDFALRTERAVALMFDIVVQNGSVSPSTRSRIMQARADRERELGRPPTEREFLEIIAVKRAEAAKPQFRSDVLARKLCIVRGTGQVHGRSFNLEQEFGLTDRVLA